MGDIGHQIATHLLVALQGAGELVKILRQAAELIAAGHRHAGGKSPAASLWVPSTSRFTGASRPRASGKVASAASRVAGRQSASWCAFAAGQS
jgi:hypothetical protein